jgi:hypothetical protein
VDRDRMVVSLGARWYRGCWPSNVAKLHRNTTLATDFLLGKNILVF